MRLCRLCVYVPCYQCRSGWCQERAKDSPPAALDPWPPMQSRPGAGECVCRQVGERAGGFRRGRERSQAQCRSCNSHQIRRRPATQERVSCTQHVVNPWHECHTAGKPAKRDAPTRRGPARRLVVAGWYLCITPLMSEPACSFQFSSPVPTPRRKPSKKPVHSTRPVRIAAQPCLIPPPPFKPTDCFR